MKTSLDDQIDVIAAWRDNPRLVLVVKIAKAAMAWDEARLEAMKLRAQRNAFACDMEPNWPNEIVDGPCWKTYEHCGEDVRRKDEAEWCPRCRERHVIHAQYMAKNTERGAKLRSLQRLCGKALT